MSSIVHFAIWANPYDTILTYHHICCTCCCRTHACASRSRPDASARTRHAQHHDVIDNSDPRRGAHLTVVEKTVSFMRNVPCFRKATQQTSRILHNLRRIHLDQGTLRPPKQPPPLGSQVFRPPRPPAPEDEQPDSTETLPEAGELVDLCNPEAQAGPEYGGPRGYEPTRYGDWAKNGRVSDF